MLEKNLDFLSKLCKNNNREWFEEHRDEYEASQEELLAFADDMIQQIQAFDPAIGEQTPKNTIFRIYRDIRFSNDKTPYKKARGVFIKRGGKKSPYASYYIHIEPGASFAGGGIYHPRKAALDAVRNKIYFEYETFFNIVNHPRFKKRFGSVSTDEKLKRMPKGYDEGHPAEYYLKFKSFIIGAPVPDHEMKGSRLAATLAELLRPAQPFIHFINEAVEEAGENEKSF
ncbi:MAG: DUF2461 domain-containing protein [Bacteroidota bacterium]